MFRQQATQDIQFLKKRLNVISRNAMEASKVYSYKYNIEILDVPQINEIKSTECRYKILC